MHKKNLETCEHSKSLDFLPSNVFRIYKYKSDFVTRSCCIVTWLCFNVCIIQTNGCCSKNKCWFLNKHSANTETPVLQLSRWYEPLENKDKTPLLFEGDQGVQAWRTKNTNLLMFKVKQSEGSVNESKVCLWVALSHISIKRFSVVRKKKTNPTLSCYSARNISGIFPLPFVLKCSACHWHAVLLKESAFERMHQGRERRLMHTNTPHNT